MLVAIDGSKESLHAADFGLSIAERNRAELILLYAFYSQLAYAYTSYLSKVEDSSSINVILHTAEDQANQWFNVIKDKMAKKNSRNLKVRSEVIVTSTSVSRAIIDYAEHNMITLIVVGTKSRSAFKKALLGSVASEVLVYSPIPVLVIK